MAETDQTHAHHTIDYVELAAPDLDAARDFYTAAFYWEFNDDGGAYGDSPIEVREKVHTSAPMTLDQALREMELVGHDFYLFHDLDTDKASVVYRRRGWSYGVLHLDLNGSATHVASDAEATAGSQAERAAAS